jgi:hypothetical protein
MSQIFEALLRSEPERSETDPATQAAGFVSKARIAEGQELFQLK